MVSDQTKKIYECSGAIPALNRSFELIRKKGEVVQIGVFAKDINEVNVGIFFPKEIHYMGTRTQKPSAWRTSLQLMAEGLGTAGEGSNYDYRSG